MILNQKFSPEIFQSESRFCRFFSGDNQVQWLEKLAKHEVIPPNRPTLFYSRWKVVWIIVSSAFLLIFSCFLKAVGSLLQYTGASRLAIGCELLSEDCLRDIKGLSAQWKFKEKLLCPLHNHHRLDTSDVYLQPNLPISSIKDKWVRATTFFKEQTSVEFYNKDGVCRGSADWFLYLYLRTLGLFPSQQAHIRAIASLFQKGAPREASILQSLDSWLFCDYERARAVLKSDTKPYHLLAIRQLKAGAYSIGFAKHVIGYIKVSDDLGFVIDMDVGVLVFKGPTQAKEVLEYFERYTKRYSNKTIWVEQRSFAKSFPEQEIA